MPRNGLCQSCRGKGTRFAIVTTVTDKHLGRVSCTTCSGTGMADADASSSAQPHRFPSVDFAPRWVAH